ncbi:ABC transporter permease [Candidatus Soleaferrea massiliensis]|uniref:ABC transporter permease n=1 Tax=Candidatus Soleaferrea massiliensis TaxID=1470354 RepID=UPI00058C543E|nr:ABC transporter permease [Candidatus Soleaferrea massiliensis]
MTTLKEAWNNFTSSVFLNLLLILQLAVCSWLFILLCNNFIDMGSGDSIKNDFTVKDETFYYSSAHITADETIPSFRMQQDFIDDLRAQKTFTYMKLDGSLSTQVREDFWVKSDAEQKLKQAGGNSNPDNMLFGSLQTTSRQNKSEATPSSPSDAIGEYEGDPMLDDRDDVVWREIKSTQMDYQAFQYFPLQYDVGQGFQKTDFLLHNDQKVVPIILGYHYKGIFQVGDILPMNLNGLPFQGKVIGILSENSYTYYTAEQLQQNYIPLLDNSIIWPYFDLEKIIGTDDLDTEPKDVQDRIFFQSNIYSNLTTAHLVASKEVSNIEVTRLYNQICERHDILRFGPEINARTIGMSMLAGETEESISILLILVCVMAFFSLFILITSMLTKIDRNIRTYLIQMMNGASIWNIVGQYILEILMVSVPACIVTALLMYRQIYYNFTFFVVLIAISLISAVLSSVIVAVKLGNLKTDELLRRKE